MSKRVIETAVGVFVLMGIISICILAFKVSGLYQTFSPTEGFEVKAYFANIGSLKPKAKVTVSGVIVGRVKAINLDPKSLDAEVVLFIYDGNALPSDSSASILTSGLIGDTYLALDPGAEDTLLESGSIIEDTNSAFVLEQMLSQFLFNKDKL